MDFWNEYEGKTIADSFPLEKLLYPEGRNGFFSTFNGTGSPGVIRLTESLNDQQEMLQQWGIVRGLNHPNLITIRKYGPTTVDDVPLTYAVMEPSDASLAEMLLERPMTVDETMEIAGSVSSALEALHGAGLVHGHVEPSAVLAVGEVVKLRSDCAHLVVDESDTKRLKAKDARDLAVLLLTALTGKRVNGASDLSAISGLPAALDQSIRNGMSGLWGVEEMSKALQAKALPTPTPQRVSEPTPPVPARIPVSSSPIVPASQVEDRKVREEERFRPTGPAPVLETYTPARGPLAGKGAWIGLAVLALLSILAWSLFHSAHKQAAAAGQPAPPATAQAVAPTAPAASEPVAAPPVAPSIAPEPPPSAAPRGSKATARDSWRVVVYTYNQASQADKKVAAIDKTHRSLQPQTFSPTGHAPFLVTLGGSMDREQASTLRRKAQESGFPRDTYIQNYTAK